jgi:putative Mn2+ efflux pump MntP
MLNLTLLIFSLIIAMVPLSVAVSSSVYRCIEWKESFRIALALALFHALMAAIGWGIGFGVRGLFTDMKMPVALFIMLFIAFRYFMDSMRQNRQIRIIISEDNRILLSFGLVTSINTALLSISLGILYPGVWLLAGFVFGMVFLLALIGIRLGKLGLLNFGRIAELTGGLGLFAVAAVILLQYLKIL